MKTPAGVRIVDVQIGGVAASAEPCILRTVLGSCVSACLHDPAMQIGGMNHFILPGDEHHADPSNGTRFGVHAMELLINEIMHLGGDRRRLVAKVFGGGNVLRGLTSPTVGELNIAFVLEFLQTERIPVVARRLGGEDAVQVRYHTGTAQVFVRSLRSRTIAAQEASYRALLARNTAIRPSEDDVTLF